MVAIGCPCPWSPILSCLSLSNTLLHKFSRVVISVGFTENREPLYHSIVTNLLTSVSIFFIQSEPRKGLEGSVGYDSVTSLCTLCDGEWRTLCLRGWSTQWVRCLLALHYVLYANKQFGRIVGSRVLFSLQRL